MRFTLDFMQKTVFEKKLAPKRNLVSDTISVLVWKPYLPGGTAERATAAKSWDPKDFKTVVRSALSSPVEFQCLFKVLFRFHFWHIWGHFSSRNFADRKSSGAWLPVNFWLLDFATIGRTSVNKTVSTNVIPGSYKIKSHWFDNLTCMDDDGRLWQSQ